MYRFKYSLSAMFPGYVCDLFKVDASLMHSELVENELKVKLVDPECYSKDNTQGFSNFSGHKVRQVESENIEWYKEVCAIAIARYGKHGGGFNRARHIRSLKRLSLGEDGVFDQRCYKYKWDKFYREFIFDRLTKGYTYMGNEVPCNELVRNFFIGIGLLQEDDAEYLFEDSK